MISSNAIAKNQLSSAAGRETSREVGDYFWSAGLLAALGFLIAFFSLDLNTPWTQDDYYNGAVWSQAAHNLLRPLRRTSEDRIQKPRSRQIIRASIMAAPIFRSRLRKPAF